MDVNAKFKFYTPTYGEPDKRCLDIVVKFKPNGSLLSKKIKKTYYWRVAQPRDLKHLLAFSVDSDKKRKAVLALTKSHFKKYESDDKLNRAMDKVKFNFKNTNITYTFTEEELNESNEIELGLVED